MRVIKLDKTKLVEYLRSLEEWGEVWGPVRKGEKFVFAKKDPSEFDLTARRTILPPKKFFVPPRFTMFSYRDGRWEEEFDESRRIIFGLHPCDIFGILILDRLFMEHYPDPYYIKRRKNTAILGFSCLPDEKCFCIATNTHSVEEGFDLFFSDVEGEFYLVWVGSSLGDDLTRIREDLFDEDVTEEDIERYIEWRRKRDKMFKTDLDLTGMPEIVEISYKRPIWEKMGEACLSCGSCSMVCPTCNCYNVVDENVFYEERIKRDRHWDSCMFKEYSLVAGGHNFREKRSDRLKLFYTHKLTGFMSQFGKPACVGCGRCVDACPVGINVPNVAKALKGEKVDAIWARGEE